MASAAMRTAPLRFERVRVDAEAPDLDQLFQNPVCITSEFDDILLREICLPLRKAWQNLETAGGEFARGLEFPGFRSATKRERREWLSCRSLYDNRPPSLFLPQTVD